VTTVDFATQVQPIFQTYCYQCHANGRKRGGFIIDQKSPALLHVTPGAPDQRDIYRAITRSMGASDHMPPVSQDQPDDQDIATIKLWIEQGANWGAGS
jgi:mono/diheme cytochrome c family protein